MSDLRGFQKPLKPHEWRTDIGLAIINYDGRAAMCSCGWRFYHAREKVRENAIDRHLNKRHNGRGIRV